MHALTDFDIRLLQVFRTVVECGGFTAAETELNISRSTISIHISNLEKRLNMRLAQRGRQGFSLTREGQAIYSAILQLDGALGNFTQLVNDLNAQLTGEVQLLTADQLDSPRQQFLAAVIQDLAAQAPQVSPSLDIMPLQQIELALLKDQAHAALMPGYRQIDGLEYVQAFSTPVYLCCSSNHPLYEKAGAEVDLPELQQHKMIHPGVDINPDGRRVLNELISAGSQTARAYQFDTRLAMILSGAWLGFIPDTLAEPLRKSGQIRYLNKATLNYSFEQFFVFKRQPRDRRRVELVKNIILKQLAL